VLLHIIPGLGGRQLRAVTRTDVQAFVNGLPLGPVTTRSVYKTLVMIFRTAQTLDHLIPASPCVRPGRGYGDDGAAGVPARL
jgi:hypothetical protein